MATNAFPTPPPPTVSHLDARSTDVFNDIFLKRVLPIPSWKAELNRVVVLPDPVSAITKGGVIVPDTAKAKTETPELGTVLATGPGRITDQGALIPTIVQVGDRVQYGKFAGSFVYDDELDVNLLIILDGDCLVHKPTGITREAPRSAPDDSTNAISYHDREAAEASYAKNHPDLKLQ